MEYFQDNIKYKQQEELLMSTAKLNVFSPILNKDIELETNGLMGPKHAALEAIFYDEIVPMYDAQLDIRWIRADLDHSIVQATISSESLKRRITTNGESTRNTLTTEISANNPSTIAFNRAFDRAVLKFLGLYKVYADSENVSQDSLREHINNAGIPITADMSEPQIEPTSPPIIMNEKEEFEMLLKKTCYLRKYPNRNGEMKYAPFYYLLKAKPEDLQHFAAANASIDLNALRITDPERAQNLTDLNRIIELNKKFMYANTVNT